MNSLAALQLDYANIDKLFVGHLHTDHIADLSVLLVAGWFAGRYTPLHVYGPSAPSPEHGIRAHVEHIMKAWDWDISSRAGGLPNAGGQAVPHEHDYSKTAVIYDKNGVQVTSFPAVHIRDGPVSYRLDWNGLSFVFSSDTEPNKWFLKEAKKADVAVHGTWPTGNAWAKISGMRGPVGETYDGPLALAADLTVINVTPDHIEVREVSPDPNGWPPHPSEEFNAAPRTDLPTGLLSDWLAEGVRR
jgi:ribonuclease Z